MEENNNIDELFQQGLKQDFPFDGNLWNQVESQLPTPSSPKRGLWVFHLNSLWVLALLSISMILKTDTNIPITTEINTPEHMTGSQLLPVEKTSVSKVESSKPNSSLVETSAIIKENQTNLKQEKTKIETPLFEDKASKKINAESPKLDKNSRYSKKIDKNQSFIVSNKLGLTIPAIDVDNDRLRLNEN